MPLIETKGAASAQGFGEFAKTGVANYIEDVFSTWLYTGNGSTQTITNGIDLSTKGGLVWVKSRSNVSRPELVDSARGTNSALYTNGSDAAGSNPSVYNLLSTGFQVGVGSGWGNESGYTYASWTFRKQPKFFDVVTYTGDGNYSTDTPAPYGRAIAHSLASRPGFIVIKAISTTSEWYVAARQNDTYWIGSNGSGTNAFRLNGIGAGSQNLWSTKPMADASVFYPAQIGAGGSSGTTNDNGVTYVAYIFAHNAGGFGLTGTDNVISCGSFTTDGSGNVPVVNLGYEPQWILWKRSDSTSNWLINDNMRGWTVNTNGSSSTGTAFLYPNLSNAEADGGTAIPITSTGFGGGTSSSSATFIYIAIRRGPMKTPTTGTSVFSPNTSSAGTGTTLTTNFPTDLQMQALRTSAVSDNTSFFDRLRGFSTTPTNETGQRLISSATDAETSPANQTRYFNNTGFQIPSNWGGSSVIYLNFRRAPGFFDVVCYTGTGAGQTVNHNLGVVPELIILKNRSSGSTDWPVKCPVGLTDTGVVYLNLDLSNATGVWQTGDTSTTFKTRASSNLFYNQSGQTYVAYLFATVAGVSKVGAYTGTGALQTINCGFTGGARFVLIKRTDSTGDWWVYDSARGISSGNDPYLLLNTTDGEVTGTNYVDTTSVGFQVTAAAPAGLNANGGTYIFLAIA